MGWGQGTVGYRSLEAQAAPSSFFRDLSLSAGRIQQPTYVGRLLRARVNSLWFYRSRFRLSREEKGLDGRHVYSSWWIEASQNEDMMGSADAAAKTNPPAVPRSYRRPSGSTRAIMNDGEGAGPKGRGNG